MDRYNRRSATGSAMGTNDDVGAIKITKAKNPYAASGYRRRK
jgi:hypothetical protein